MNESCAQLFASAARKRNARRRPHALISKLNQSILPELPPLCPQYCGQDGNDKADAHAKMRCVRTVLPYSSLALRRRLSIYAPPHRAAIHDDKEQLVSMAA